MAERSKVDSNFWKLTPQTIHTLHEFVREWLQLVTIDNPFEKSECSIS